MPFHRLLVAHTLAGTFAFCLCVQAQGKSSDLPDTPARAALKKVCGNCHEVETVVASRRTRIGWERSVDDMVTRGAEGSDDDMAAIVDYLTAYFGKVNVNTAPAVELEKLLGFSASEAQAIVAYRERNGKIKDFEELKKVQGVSADKLQAKRGLIAFSL